MRTAKYHDYTLFRVLLFIILIILGIFAYKHFVKAPCEHNIGSWVTVKATCTEDGYRYKECSKCGEQFSNEVLAATGHDTTVVTIESATCTKEGIKCNECLVCGDQSDFKAIPVVEHTPGKSVIENEKHTLAEGASYEECVYCTECDEQLSMKKVSVEHKTEKIVETTDPTCEEKGVVETTIYCKDCNKAISTESKDVAPLGHNFAWALVSENNNLVVTGQCTEIGCGHKYDPKVDDTYEINYLGKNEDKSLVPGCGGGYDIYEATISENGAVIETVALKVYLPADPAADHALYIRLKDANGNWVVMDPENYSDYKLNEDGYIVDDNGDLVDFLQYALKDENGTYFNASTLGFVKVANSEWDENGFAYGTYKCSNDVSQEFEHWVTVRIYNDLAK